MAREPVRFGLIGVDHLHAFSMVGLLAAAGGEFAAFQAEPGPLVEGTIVAAVQAGLGASIDEVASAAEQAATLPKGVGGHP